MLSQVQQLFLDIIGTSDYRESGSSEEIYLTCPFCGRANKFYVSSKGAWICFHCESRGRSLTSFVMQYDRCTFKQAQEILKEYNYSDRQVELNLNTDESTSLLTKLSIIGDNQQNKVILKPAQPLEGWKSLARNMYNPESYPYLNYLYKRGIPLQQIMDYNIGYIVNGRVKRPGNKDLKVWKSIVFPTFNQEGQVVYWNTRSIEPNPFIKSINAPADKESYSKRNTVFNQDRITNNSNLVICEGVFNALTCCQDPYIGIATFGKAVTDDQIKLIKGLKPRNYYIFLDNDAKKQELDLAKRLHQEGISYDKIYLVRNPYGKRDANDLGMTEVRSLLDQAQPITIMDLISLAKEG